MVKLFISGFPLDITEMELAQLIGPHGELTTIKIVRDKQTKKCKGYAFIEMASQKDAENAVIALDGVMMQDRELTLKISEEKTPAVKPNFIRSEKSGSSSWSKRHDRPTEERGKRPRRPRV